MLNFYDKKDVITSNDKIIYRNVFLFIEIVKFIADFVKYHATRIRFHRCLRDAALKWYRNELKQKHRDVLKRDEYLNKWDKKITIRFKIDESEILNLLIKNKYTIENVRSKRFVDVYVQQMIHHARNVEFIMISNQLNWIRMNIIASLQRDINKSHADMIIIDFIRDLKEKQYSWRNFYRMKFFQTQIKKRWKSQSLLIQNQYDNDFYFQQNIDYRQKDFYVNNSNYNNNNRNNFRYDNNFRNDRNYDQVNRNQYQKFINQFTQFQQQRLIKTFFVKQFFWTRSLQDVSAMSVSTMFQQIYYQKKTKSRKKCISRTRIEKHFSKIVSARVSKRYNKFVL